MASDATEAIDNLLFLATQKSEGVESLLENFFSFLGRRTDFFFPSEEKDPNLSLERCVSLVSRHCRKAGAAAIERKRREKEANKLQEQAQNCKPVDKKPLEEPSTAKESKFTDDSDEDGSPPPGNGGSTRWYEWTQTLGTLEVSVCVPAGTSGKDVSLRLTPTDMHVFISGSELFGGELYDRVKSDECIWALADGKTLQISLEKQSSTHWWPCVIKGHPEIDVKRIVPENSKLSDLDAETRATVERMMFDQRQKAAGLPTSSQRSQYEALERFKKAHPELDFSNANINFSS